MVDLRIDIRTKEMLNITPCKECCSDDNMVSQIYPSELQLNKANASDTEAAFLDLHLSISNFSLASLAFYLFSPTRLINSIKHEHSSKILSILQLSQVGFTGVGQLNAICHIINSCSCIIEFIKLVAKKR